MAGRISALCLVLLLAALTLAGCGQAGEPTGNLILTNYAAETIANISVSHDGQIVEISEAGIRDTQLCRFQLPEEDNYAYTLSFEDTEGRTVSETFTDDFSGGAAVLLRADRSEEGWDISYDAQS